MFPLATLSTLLLVPSVSVPGPRPVVLPNPAAVCRAIMANEIVDLQPTGRIALAGGTIELKPVMSPFGLAVTAQGQPIFDATVVVKNLPEPGSLGDYQSFVVWLASPSLDQMMSLGAITNDKAITARVDFIKMMYIVSAEPKANVNGQKFSGPIVLVGRSASARVQNMAGCDIYDTTGGMGG